MLPVIAERLLPTTKASLLRTLPADLVCRQATPRPPPAPCRIPPMQWRGENYSAQAFLLGRTRSTHKVATTRLDSSQSLGEQKVGGGCDVAATPLQGANRVDAAASANGLQLRDVLFARGVAAAAAAAACEGGSEPAQPHTCRRAQSRRLLERRARRPRGKRNRVPSARSRGGLLVR